jgi:serine/threonine protein kinase
MAVDPRRVKELFVALLDLPDPQARQAFLQRECGADAELRQRLEALLKAHEHPDSVLDRPLAAVGGPLDAGATGSQAPASDPADSPHRGPDEEVGTVIAGRYKLLEQIGEGGMGTVWVAEQTQPVRRKVALKLIKAGMDSKTVLSRFEAERQALALMDHPNIAKVLDGGTTENGRPFFVMEYVKGVPFTRYCDDARLSIAERLALFVPVCHAVQHAHQKGIIHRDLKPTNMLICLYDGKPVPKVIDFGLAKAMHQPLTEHTLHTAHGAMVGTPLYMSPEQAEFNNLDVDTRTDVYALGVVLYELLTGTTPLEKQRFQKAAWHEILRLIKEEEPPRPSARLSGSGSLPSLAAQRQLEPVKLAKLVRGELDWIVMKCLEKDRSRRYDTANGLARDVERYLADEVVEARPPSAGYRLRKLVRKHRTALAMAAIVLLLVVAGVAVSTWQAVRAIRSENEARLLQAKAEEEEKKALKSADEARAMFRFFKEVTHEARFNVKEGNEWRPKTVEEAAAIIDSEPVRAIFSDKPLVEADIRQWIATGFDFDSPVGKHSYDLIGVVFVEGTQKGPQTVDTYLGKEMFQRRFYYDRDAIRHHLERALELRSVHLGPNHPKTLDTMLLFGRAHMFDNNPKALRLLGDLVARASVTFGPVNDKTMEYRDWLARAYENAEKHDEALRLWEEIYTLTKNTLGVDHNDTLNCSDS